MKNCVITISFIVLVVSCQKPHRSATESDSECGSEIDPAQLQSQDSTPPESLKKPTIRHEGRVYSVEEWNELEQEEAKSKAAWEAAQAQLEELKRIQNLTPFEEALQPKGYKSVASAFIVKIDAERKASLERVIYGKAPTDYVMYLRSIEASRSYLVGAVLPSYLFNADREEERFCIPLTMDDKFTDGGGLTRAFSVEEVERALK